MSAVISKPLLIELFTEELPPKALLMLSLSFRDALVARLAAAGLVHGDGLCQQPGCLLRGDRAASEGDGDGCENEQAQAMGAIQHGDPRHFGYSSLRKLNPKPDFSTNGKRPHSNGTEAGSADAARRDRQSGINPGRCASRWRSRRWSTGATASPG